MAGKKDEQEDLDDDIISPISSTEHPHRAHAPDQVQNKSEENVGSGPLYDELFDPIMFTEHAGNNHCPKLKAGKREKREKKSSLSTIQVPNASPKPRSSLSKASGKRRGSRRRSKRQGTQETSRENWTDLVQNLIRLMKASKRGRRHSDPDQRRKMKRAFRKQVTILLVPFFKKPKEAATFLALQEARDRVSKGKEGSLPEPRETRQGREGEACDGPAGRGAMVFKHSGRNLPYSDKKFATWSMFSVDWDSTRVQRRRVARKRTELKHELGIDDALTEIICNAPERNTLSLQSMVEPKRNRAVELRRANERKHWQLLKDEIICIITENIRMLTLIKKLCRPEVLAKLGQEATVVGTSQSFNSFVSTLPVEGDVNSWLENGNLEPENLVEDEDEIITRFLQTNQDITTEDGCGSQGRDGTVNHAQSSIRSLKSENGSSFSNLSYELEELDDVIRSALDDFAPERD
ncbi:hypothetical protein FGB62_77g036 [Gracilaria domingensis]|nr:hypothetical protein FGB62_77g036 [Gracilaria domingensis]